MQFFKPNFWDKNNFSFLSIILLPITWIFFLVQLFNRLITKEKIFSIPIICVGNIYLGGTGKTPLCIEIFSILKNLDKKPVFIKKNYIAFKDETNLLKQTGSVYESKKRIYGINNAIKNNAGIAILDDGFQDFSIKKNLSIVCFNEKQWIGNGLTLPSGPLREKLSALNRANFVMINGKKNTNIENKILNYNKKIKIFYSKYKSINIDAFKDKKIICFAGIGNPINFFSLLLEYNLNIIEKINFPDHYNYSNMELENLIEKSKNNNAILLTTEKDYLRINEIYRKKINFLKIKTIIEDNDKFIEEVKKFI